MTNNLIPLRIAGVGYALPEAVITNEDLTKLYDTSDEWITARTGIKTRHIATEETTTSMSIEAAQKALEDANIKAEELDLIIAATVTSDRIIPMLSAICRRQRNLSGRSRKRNLCGTIPNTWKGFTGADWILPERKMKRKRLNVT